MRFLLSLASFVAVLLAASFARAEPCVQAVDCTQATPTRMRSIPLFVTGIVLDVAGGAGVAAGAGLIAAGNDCTGTAAGCGVANAVLDIAGIGALAGGAVLLAIGIPLTAVGAASVPDVKSSSAVPKVRVSGTGGVLEWSF
jgi:hypothetical protein